MAQSRLSILKLPANERGEDYVVGDIHGHFDALQSLLARVNFDPTVDRLFSVGDRGDRGPHSEKCFKMLEQPWFKAVAGNHDLALREYFQSLRPRDLGKVHSAVAKDAETLLRFNGGDWALKLRFTPGKVVAVGRLALTQPHVIVVGEGKERFNIVHAFFHDPRYNDRWTDERIDASDGVRGLRALDLIERFVGSRAPLDYPMLAEESAGLSLTYCGHSPVPEIRMSLGHMMIDTGCGKRAVRCDRKLTMVRHSDQQIFQEVTARLAEPQPAR